MRNHILMRIDPRTDRLEVFDPKTNQPIAIASTAPAGASDGISSGPTNTHTSTHTNAIGNLERGIATEARITQMEMTL